MNSPSFKYATHELMSVTIFAWFFLMLHKNKNRYFAPKVLYIYFILCARMNAKVNETNREIGKVLLPAALTDSFLRWCCGCGRGLPGGKRGQCMMKASRIIGKKRCSIVILAALCTLAVLMCGTAAADRVGFSCPAGCDCFVVGADSRTQYDEFNKTLQFIKPNKDGLDFMVLPGDMDYVLVNKENYTDVELSGLQTYWVVGNHEMDVGDEVNISNLYPSLPNTLYYL